ncbi:MAG TPA: O-antigen ligase family protein [Terriglobia bacterium]|nr:O-antigen ligase family protein [Terriglobia bacterium]
MSTEARTTKAPNSGFGWITKGFEAGLLFVLPLVFYRGFAEQFTYPKLFLTELLVFLGCAVWAAGLVWGKFNWPSGFRLGLPLGIFSAAILLSCFASPVASFSYSEAIYFLCGPLWLLMLASWRRGPAGVQAIGGFVAAAGAVASGIALIQWTGHDPLLFGGYSVQWGSMVPRMRLYSTFGNPNFLCGYLIGAIFPAVALTLTAPQRFWKILCGIATIMIFAVIVETRSYGGWAALVAGALVAYLVLVRTGKPSTLASAEEKTQTGGTVRSHWAPTCVVAIALIGSLDQTLGTRIAGRIYLSRVAWQMFLEHPLLGGGWGTFQLGFLDHQARFLAAHPELTRYWTMAWELHNDPLQLLVEAGVLGFAAFAWLLVTYVREVRKTPRVAAARQDVVWLSASAGGAAAILGDSLVNFQFTVAPTLILLFTFLAFPFMLTTLRNSSGAEAQKKRSAGAHQGFLLRALGGIGVAALCAGLLTQATQRALAEIDYQQGINLESVGDFAGAEQIDRRGLSRAPENGRLHFALARVLYLQQQYEPALGEAELAEFTYSDSHLVVLQARILDRMGRSAEALEGFRRALLLDPTLKSVQADIDRLAKSTSQ